MDDTRVDRGGRKERGGLYSETIAITVAQAGLAEKEAEEQEKEELTKILESSAKKIEITVEAAHQLTSLDRESASFLRLASAEPISSSTSSAHIASPMQKKESGSLPSNSSTERQSSAGSSTTSLGLPQSPPQFVWELCFFSLFYFSIRRKNGSSLWFSSRFSKKRPRKRARQTCY